jgi:hypothetical protein
LVANGNFLSSEAKEYPESMIRAIARAAIAAIQSNRAARTISTEDATPFLERYAPLFQRHDPYDPDHLRQEMGKDFAGGSGQRRCKKRRDLSKHACFHDRVPASNESNRSHGDVDVDALRGLAREVASLFTKGRLDAWTTGIMTFDHLLLSGLSTAEEVLEALHGDETIEAMIVTDGDLQAYELYIQTVLTFWCQHGALRCEAGRWQLDAAWRDRAMRWVSACKVDSRPV